MGILKEIIDKKKIRVDDAKSNMSLSDLRSKIGELAGPRPFRDVIKRKEGEGTNVIAEIKKASPSKGLIRADFDPVSIGKIYVEKGASAISVLTEEDYFQGNLKFIREVKDATSIPVLRKDFIFDEYQIYEARAHGADAILLIAAIVSKGQSDEYMHVAFELGLSVLFEVHNNKELDMVLQVGAPVVGINNRNLDTLAIDLNTTFAMLKDIPLDRIVVTESGISMREDVIRFEKSRVDAILIGTALMREKDVAAKYDELFFAR